MSTTPTVVRAVVVPTLGLALEVTPPTAGGAVTSYKVILSGGATYTGIPYTARQAGGSHILPRFGAFTRDASVTFSVYALQGATYTAASDPFTVTITADAARATVIRQRIFELITNANLSLVAERIQVCSTLWGAPSIAPAQNPIGHGFASCVEIQYPQTEEQVEATARDVETVTVPIRVLAPTGDMNDVQDGADYVLRTIELCRRTLRNSDKVALGLNMFGVVPGAIHFSGTATPEVVNTGIVEATFSVSVKVRFEETVALT